MANNHIHDYYSIFSYFAEQMGEPFEWWEDKKVLDFGGNWGNVLRDPKCTIKPENYWAVDVSKSAMEAGAARFPRAHWHHYNRWNFMYNYTGNLHEPLPDMGTFDVILSYSVLTIGEMPEMVRTINEDLLPLLNPGGVFMNTYLSMDDEWPMRFFLRKRGNTPEEVQQLLDEARSKDFVYFVGKNILTQSEEELRSLPQDVMLTFYKDEKIQQLFPTCEIKPVVLRDDRHCQKCMVFRNTGL